MYAAVASWSDSQVQEQVSSQSLSGSHSHVRCSSRNTDTRMSTSTFTLGSVVTHSKPEISESSPARYSAPSPSTNALRYWEKSMAPSFENVIGAQPNDATETQSANMNPFTETSIRRRCRREPASHS